MRAAIDRLLAQAVGLHRAGDLAKAADAYRHLLRIAPAHKIGFANLAVALGAAGEIAAATAAGRRALLLDPLDSASWFNLGNLHRRAAAWQDAAAAFRNALRLDPGMPAAALNLGLTSADLRDPDAALPQLRRAAHLKPEVTSYRLAVAKGLRDQMRPTEAERAVRDALALAPADPTGWHLRGLLHRSRGRFAEAVACFDRALRLQPADRTEIDSVRLFSLAVDPGRSPEAAAAAHRAWGSRFAAAPAAPAVARTPRRLRIGYVSGDFFRHSVAHFFLPLLEQHDRSRFALHLYSETAVEDDVTARIRGAADRWVRTRGWSDDRFAALLRADELDVLVDLSGHTVGNRLVAMARRLAPVQVSWLGYPHSTGLPAMDYRIVDAVTDPPGSDALSSERLVRMAPGFHCYAPLDPAPSDAREPGGGITFGAFNDLYKISDGVVAAWSQLLLDLPESTLLLKTRPLASGDERALLAARFAAHGVAADRLRMLGWTETQREHLALHRQVDVALDTFPYNGTTTTCDALWMGVPVVTLLGASHIARVGASLLAQAGLDDLVATDAADYCARAVALACDPVRLRRLRSGLRPTMTTGPLGDAAAFARRFEAALLDMLGAR